MAKVQDGKFQNLTVNFQTLMQIPLSSRLDMIESRRGRDILASIDPSLLPDLFPAHYKRDQGFARTLESLTGYRYSAQMTKEGETKLVRGEQVSEEGRRSVREGRAVSPRNDTAVAIPGWMSEVQKRTGVAIDASAEGVGTLKGRSAVQKSVYDAFVKAGFSDSQSRALTAEVGRENNFEERHIFGTHSEPGGGAGVRGRPNQGMLSWGDPSRRRAFLEHMQNEGMVDDRGNIKPGQSSLEAQARFVRKEMGSYNKASQAFLANPNISHKDAETLLASYIGWDIAGRHINAGEHIARKDNYRASLDRILSQPEFTSQEGEMPRLPDGLANKLVQEYSRMTDAQKRNFHRALDKLGNGDANAGVAQINEIYSKDPQRTVEQSKSSSGFSLPVEEGRVSSRFGMRKDPIQGDARMHSGIDYAVPEGTNVRSIQGGRVVFAGNKGGYGKTVEIEHPDGTRTRYAHLREFGVQPGEEVTAGRNIALSGSTGRSTGPHLHVETEMLDERTGAYRKINPETYMENLRARHLKTLEETASARPAETVSPVAAAPQTAEESTQPVPGFAYGGEMQTDAKELNAVPLDQPRTDMAVPIDKRDNMAVVDETGKTQFTMNDKEQASLGEGKVEVKTREQSRADELEPRIRQMEQNEQVREQEKKRAEREASQPSIIADDMNNNNIQRMNQDMAGATDELFKTPSFRRAMANRHGIKDQDATGDHFSYGSYGV
jgi:murein DD-endopeptidase MepM/ murein hydrolase activator NlpD